MEQINIYCDESCHLEHDKNNKYMVLGAIYCYSKDVTMYNDFIKKIKLENYISEHSETKWGKLSRCNLKYYSKILDFFFSEENNISFRAIIIDKSKLKHKEHHQSHDEFYYKMYFLLIKQIINNLSTNKIYIDEKDTHNNERILKLKKILRNKFYDYNSKKIAPIQVVKSHEIQLMQITDILTGAISYELNNKNKLNDAKLSIIEKIETQTGQKISKKKNFHGLKFDLFYFKEDTAYE